MLEIETKCYVDPDREIVYEVTKTHSREIKIKEDTTVVKYSYDLKGVEDPSIILHKVPEENITVV